MGWGRSRRARTPNPGTLGAVAPGAGPGGGAGSGRRRGAAGDARGARPPSESVRPSENRCGERCPLTVTFKALSPRPPRPAHEPPHALPSAGEGRIWPPVPPPKAQGGPKGPGVVRTPPLLALFTPLAALELPSQGLSALFWHPRGAGQDAAVGPGAPRSARWDAEGWSQEPGGVPKTGLSTPGGGILLPSHPSWHPGAEVPLPPSCQRRVAWHRGRARHFYPELIQLLGFPSQSSLHKVLGQR